MARAARLGPRAPSTAARYIVLAVTAAICLLPFVFMVSNSLKTYAETVTRVSPDPLSPDFWPSRPRWENFAEVWKGDEFGRYFANSLVISLVTLCGTLATSCLAAYAFAKLRFPGREAIFSVFLATFMVPETATLVPNFLLVGALGWVDRLAGLTVPFFASAFYIFFLRQFFKQIPDSLLESAKLEGASSLRILVSIALPLSRSAIFTVAFLDLASSWNSLQWPLVVVQTPRWRPLALGLTRLISEEGAQMQLRMAGALIAVAPVLIVYIAAQRRIVATVSGEGLKE